MKIKYLLALLFPFIFNTSYADTISMGSCRDECSWSKELTRGIIGSNQIGALFKVTLVGGISKNLNEIEEMIPDIKWGNQPHSIYVFCSREIPLVMMQNGDSYQITFLDLSERGMIPSVLDSDLSVYQSVCHNIGINRNSAMPIEDFVNKFLYSASQQSFNKIANKIKKPTDILLIK